MDVKRCSDERGTDMDKKELEREIERKRDEMIRVGMEKGLNDPETIRLSQELDKLINKAMGSE